MGDILYLLRGYNYYSDSPQYSDNRNPELKIPFSCLMKYWPHHSKPNTKNSSNERKNPESPLRNSPPLVDRLNLVGPHDEVRDEINDENIVKHSFISFHVKWNSSTSLSHVHRFERFLYLERVRGSSLVELSDRIRKPEDQDEFLE